MFLTSQKVSEFNSNDIQSSQQTIKNIFSISKEKVHQSHQELVKNILESGFDESNLNKLYVYYKTKIQAFLKLMNKKIKDLVLTHILSSFKIQIGNLAHLKTFKNVKEFEYSTKTI